MSSAAKFASQVLVVCSVAATGSVLKAQSSNTWSFYQLNKSSTFQQGCFPPCLCPVMVALPVEGTFILVPTGLNGLFSTYLVMNVNWSVTIDSTNLIVTGSGTYRVSAGSAPQQELTLDLELGAGNLDHFDSGLVLAGSAGFPDVQATISLHGQVCFDTVFVVNASPIAVPPVSLAFAGSNRVILSWPMAPGPYILKVSSDLATTNWTAVTNTPTVTDQQNQVSLGRAAGNQFYRLEPKAN